MTIGRERVIKNAGTWRIILSFVSLVFAFTLGFTILWAS